jgi:NTP pyrophosphatase (non-canonical NTP hydrolase)
MTVYDLIESNKKLFDDARELWGDDVMRQWLIEELNECAVSASHVYRGKVGEDELLGEMADALLMILQMANQLGPAAFAVVVQEKVLRLRTKIDRKAPFAHDQ